MRIDYERKVFYLEMILISLLFLLIGAAMNEFAMRNNNNKMPVLNEYYSYETENHFSFSIDDKDKIDYWYFADIIPVNLIYVAGRASIGDFVMVLSFIGMLSNIILMRWGKWKVYHEN